MTKSKTTSKRVKNLTSELNQKWRLKSSISQKKFWCIDTVILNLYAFFAKCVKYNTQRHKLRTAYSTNDYRGKWTVIY